jgi:pyruvate/2-oxoglutarate dehydrogenase complex dihydrolipoamide acyltransferase (E2) component
MAYEFKLPDLGEGLTEGEIARWLVEEGQEIAEDDPLVEIATDKTTVEIPSPAAGLVSRILVQEGEVVPVGTVLVVIGADGPAAAAPAATAPAAAAPAAAALEPAAVAEPKIPPSNTLQLGEKVRATPLVRRLAQELGVELEAISGTGPQGRVTEDDVRSIGSGETPRPQPEGRREPIRREPIRGIRRQMFEHLTTAHREIPAVTWVEECDFGATELKLLVPLVLKAVAESLREFPELNARIDDGHLVYAERADIGVAIQTEQGLVVPVVRDCGSRTLEELDQEVRRLAQSAAAGTLAPEELRGGTFTVTSAGRSAGLFVTPLINHPEVAILGIHRIEDRAVVRDGEIVVRRMGNVSVTFDHRVIDGKRAADFGLSVIAQLEKR